MNQLSSEVFRAVKLVHVILHWWARVTLHLSKPMGCIATSEWEWCISVEMHSSEGVSESCSVVSDSLWPHGLYSPWNSPGQNTGVGSLSLLQEIFPTQGSNPGFPHCRWILYQLSNKRSLRILEWVAYPFSSRPSRPRIWTGFFCIAGGFFTNCGIREAHLYLLILIC